ncbi:type III PLP-dependent enzyme [Shewanella surugensis]|uniref:Type III PLP-dependent enzyme n=1 Tax=Shewanella surugensis TaxID=212020 RepID=A0ABT0LCI0_9GAMM|nr:type III PLP-dependent enzyme [Shewanella surugensis]MCL1125418.1 type III PLP-dependent enzyme [Shewanella surugensis]
MNNTLTPPKNTPTSHDETSSFEPSVENEWVNNVAVQRSRINNAITQLAAKSPIDTPLCAYIYDLPALAQHAQSIVAALPDNCEFYYAAKANPEENILATLAPIVHGFESASGGELNWLHQCQSDVPIIFGGPGKLVSELAQAIDLNIEAIHVESLTELKRIGLLCQQKQANCRILLRMNISLEGIEGTRLTMGGKPTPFGIDREDLPAALSILRDFPQIELLGFHFHLMSHQLDKARHLALMELYFTTFKRWQEQFSLDVKLLNVGGGIGIDYANPAQLFDWTGFCDDLGQLIQRENMQAVTVRFECGRFVTANAGFYVMEVLDIKQSHGEWFVIGHGGTHHFRTPAAQNHNHPFYVKQREMLQSGNELNINSGLIRQKAIVVGQLCTPKDVLARQVNIETVQIGDYVVFTQAGAYAWNISHQHFLMHAAPVMHFID